MAQKHNKDHQPKKHHFVPAFYLRGWERPEVNGKLIECRNLDPHPVAYKDVTSENTGYRKHLYSKTTSEIDVLDHSFEHVVMSRLDNDAAKVLPMFLSDRHSLNTTSKRTWASFLYTQLRRGPIDKKTDTTTRKNMWNRPTQEQQQWYSNVRLPEMPETFADLLAATPHYEHDEMFFDAFEREIFNSPVLEFLMSLRWEVRKLINPKFPLLTADQPVFCNNRLGHKDGLIYMPLSPSALFFALPKTSKAHEILDNGSENNVVRFCNKSMVEGADEYVWTNYDGHKLFIEKWIGTKKRQSMSSIVKKSFDEMPDPTWENLMNSEGL